MIEIVEKNVAENDEKTRIVLDAINSDPYLIDEDRDVLMKNFEKWNSRTYEIMDYRTSRNDGQVVDAGHRVWRIQDNGKKRQVEGLEWTFALMKANFLFNHYHNDLPF